MKYITLTHGYKPSMESAGKLNIMDIPGGPACMLQSNEHYPIVVVTPTYCMLGFNSMKDLVKRFGIGWRTKGIVKYIGFVKN